MATRAGQYNRAEPALVEQRATPRLRLSVTRATARRHGATASEAELHDISIYGCRIAVSDDQPLGERLWLRLDGGMPIAATVGWSHDGFAGCRFDTPIERAGRGRWTIWQGERSINRGISSTKLQGRWRRASGSALIGSQPSFTAPFEPGSAKM